MERSPSNPTAEQLDAEIADIDRQLLELDGHLAHHSETGSNSPDDDGQEAAQDMQDMATGPGFKMDKLRHRRAELIAQKEALNS